MAQPMLDRWTEMSLWEHLDALAAGTAITVDRPRGSAHPRFGQFVYPLDYGYFTGTDGGDGSGIDVWVGADRAVGVTAVICTFDPVRRNSEVKVALGCDEADLVRLEEFYRCQPQAAHIVRRGRLR